jgi:hypothetical protein
MSFYQNSDLSHSNKMYLLESKLISLNSTSSDYTSTQRNFDTYMYLSSLSNQSDYTFKNNSSSNMGRSINYSISQWTNEGIF